MSAKPTSLNNGKGFLLNNNSYISIGIVILLVGATIWIKDGQAASRTIAIEVKGELTHYKELQKLSAELLVAKIDALAEVVKNGSSWTNKEHRRFAEQLQELNPALRVPKPE